MLTIHIRVQTSSEYVIDTMRFRDQAALVRYLRERRVTREQIQKALEGLARQGEYTICQESS
jgi:hypothetical protein